MRERGVKTRGDDKSEGSKKHGGDDKREGNINKGVMIREK